MTSKSNEEFYLDDLSDYPDSYSEKDSDDDSDEGDIKIRKRKSVLTHWYSDSEEDEPSNKKGDADKGEGDEDDGWTKVDVAVDLEPYKADPGIKFIPKATDNIMESVNLFFGDDFFEHLANESNRYHSQVVGKHKNKFRDENWTDITMLEMKKFLGLILLMGQVKKGVLDDYWSTDQFMKTPYFPEVMSRERFMQIMSIWHFCNNEKISKNSRRLAKVQPVIDYLQQKFIKAYTPRRHLTLEECIIPWSGRLSVRVSRPSKITKYGILVRMLCEAVSGYICNMQLYDTDNNKLQDTLSTIVEPFKNIWHHLYQDNYYNSVEIAEILLRNKVRMCGVLRRNKDLPRSLQRVRLSKGKYDFRRNRQILFEVWNNGRQNVRMISTIHAAQMMESQSKHKKSKVSTQKPSSVVCYDKYTKGIDRAEHHLSYYSIFRKTKKWTKRVVMFFINCALFNSFKMFTAINDKKYFTYRRFLHRVAMSWTQNDENIFDERPLKSRKKSSAASSKADHPKRLSKTEEHKLVKAPTKGKGSPLLKPCQVCLAHNKMSKTGSSCKLCAVPLHKGACFDRYHSSKKY